jgi:hypothetical protein
MGLIFRIPAIIIMFLTSGWGTFICLAFIYEQFGFSGAIGAFFLFPVVFVLTPFYMGFADSNWLPLILIYGGAIPGVILLAISDYIDKR